MASLSFVPLKPEPVNIPKGLNLTWHAHPSKLADPSQQAVINTTDGKTVYVFSYDDNRDSVAFVKYDGNTPGTPVEVKKVRYPWALGLDPKDKKVTVAGQDNNVVDVTYETLGIS